MPEYEIGSICNQGGRVVMGPDGTGMSCDCVAFNGGHTPNLRTASMVDTDSFNSVQPFVEQVIVRCADLRFFKK